MNILLIMIRWFLVGSSDHPIYPQLSSEVSELRTIQLSRVSQGRWLIPSSSEKKAEEAKESLFDRLVKDLKNITRAQTGGHLLGKPG